MTRIKHLLEAAGLHLLFGAFRILPLDVASYVGGFLGRCIGPFFKAHKTAEKNISMVFPQLTDREKFALLNNMWDNLGRVAAEFSRLPEDKLYARVNLHGIENLPPPDKAVLFFSGHFGNWELTYPIPFRHGIPIILAYRQANNPYADKVINDLRATQSGGAFPKGPQGGLKLMRALKKGESLAMLLDQKMNDGIPVPFFGRDAMTAPAIAEFALRYDMPIIPVSCVRTKGVHFEGTVHPPLAYEKTGNQEKDVLAIMTAINQTFERWICAHPEQWFWVHQRWPKVSP